jgi:hypothetical protein
MDIKTIIVKEYLESLTESEELDYIFPLFLESQGYIIMSKPTESKGLSQYGKDVVAIGIDFEDGIKKRFYFEIKGGGDRNISNSTYIKPDGIRESLIEAKDKKFTLKKEYEKLPLKIVLVHNGEVKADVRDIMEDFVQKEFPDDGEIEFGRWGISELTKFFSEKFFNEFLLAYKKVTKLFNKTILNLDVDDRVSRDFETMLDILFVKIRREDYRKTLPRKWKMFFESLRLISFIIYTEAKEYNNLDIAKRYLTRLVIYLWYWILKCKLEYDDKIQQYFSKIFDFYLYVMEEYFQRTLPIALKKDGLFYDKGGRYEQVGFTMRTFEYLQYLCWFMNLNNVKDKDKVIAGILNNNNVSARPLLDIHSIPIISVLNLFIECDNRDAAKAYLSDVLFYLRLAKEKYNRLPDANNSEKNVIRLIVTGEKSIYYSDSTSLLLTALLEFIVILEMKEEYEIMLEFIKKHKIDLGLFIPHHSINSTSKHLIEDNENDLEEQLFSKYFFCDGYQSQTILSKDFIKDISFEEFKTNIQTKKEEFIYEYRTDSSYSPFLRDLAHIYFRTPYFPDTWRDLL